MKAKDTSKTEDRIDAVAKTEDQPDSSPRPGGDGISEAPVARVEVEVEAPERQQEQREPLHLPVGLQEVRESEVFIERGPGLPDSYPGERLRVMARDPGTLFVYWGAAPDEVEGWEVQAFDDSGVPLDTFRTGAIGRSGYLHVRPEAIGRVTLRPIRQGVAREPIAETAFGVATSAVGTSGEIWAELRELPEEPLVTGPYYPPGSRIPGRRSPSPRFRLDAVEEPGPRPMVLSPSLPGSPYEIPSSPSEGEHRS
jgi:hypothetical protein